MDCYSYSSFKTCLVILGRVFIPSLDFSPYHSDRCDEWMRKLATRGYNLRKRYFRGELLFFVAFSAKCPKL